MEKYNVEEFYHKTILKVAQDFIEILKVDEYADINIRQYFVSSSPADLEEILEKIGWERGIYEENSLDTWITMIHKDYNFDIIIFFNGYYGDLRLSRREKRKYYEI